MGGAGESEEAKFSEPGPRLDRNRGHVRRCHSRWIKAGTRLGSDPYPDEWRSEQCGGCRFYVRLQGGFRSDWGVCSNEVSPRDGKVTFEHDGCDAFVSASEGWQ
jgi:hypothetical protein